MKAAYEVGLVRNRSSMLQTQPSKTTLNVQQDSPLQARSASGSLIDDKHNKPTRRRRRMPQVNVIMAVVLLGIALWTRLYKIQWASKVVWDEAHFGKFAGYYLKRTFYFDVHPPLGKMLNAFAGLIAGFDGKFEFKSGESYPPDVKYGVMRVWNGLFGALITPLAYMTGVHLRMSQTGATMLGLLTIFDNALCVISRFILLDSMLLFFTALAVYSLAVFRNQQLFAPLSPDWWLWLAFSGASLGLVVSVKWVGLFTIAIVGLHTINDLWDMLADSKMSLRDYLTHWGARIACLIVLPILIYMFTFVLHFTILNHSGPGDAQMSSLFQSGLQGINFGSGPLEIAYGSVVTVKNSGRGGALLHSHVQVYPEGSEEQQVTCYAHKDGNNDWEIMYPIGQEPQNKTQVRYIQDMDEVRLRHVSTKKTLRSQRIPAQVSKDEWEVSCYSNATNPDIGDTWIIERVKDITGVRGKRVRSLSTQFRIRHKASRCLLGAWRKTLPSWGFKQEEVVCQKEWKNDDAHNYWNVENHANSLLPAEKGAKIKSTFISDFIDLNVGMWTSNNALTLDENKEPDALVSFPWHWPFLLKTLRMDGWGDNEIKYLMIGNPIIWWTSTASLVIFSAALLIYAIRSKRGDGDFRSFSEWDDFWFAFKVAVLGWFLNYSPFYIMGRVMYLHHYYPALYYAIISLSFVLDHFCKRMPRILGLAVLAAFSMLCIVIFLYFADLTFGMSYPSVQYESRQWLSSWKFVDY